MIMVEKPILTALYPVSELYGMVFPKGGYSRWVWRWDCNFNHVNCDLLVKVSLNIQIDGKPPRIRTKQGRLDRLDGNLRLFRLHLNQVYCRKHLYVWLIIVWNKQ